MTATDSQFKIKDVCIIYIHTWGQGQQLTARRRETEIKEQNMENVTTWGICTKGLYGGILCTILTSL